jgi:L-ascorbate metabolism protein UlaG (beta-lactamase superfamily)
MIISYLGKQFFKLSFGDTVLAFNPISKDSKNPVKPSKFGADIVLGSTNHPDYNGFDMTAHGETVPFIIDGPGDYEVKGIAIKGFLSESQVGGAYHVNTIYTLSFDSISICFIGALGNEKISPDTLELLGSPDILFIPIGGNGVLTPAAAAKFALTLDPKLIIPMDYGDEMTPEALKLFFKEIGEEKVAPVDKLTLKKKDLEGKEGDVVVLSY